MTGVRRAAASNVINLTLCFGVIETYEAICSMLWEGSGWLLIDKSRALLLTLGVLVGLSARP